MSKSLNQTYFDEYIKRQLLFNDLHKSQFLEVRRILSSYEKRIIQELVIVYENPVKNARTIKRLKKELSLFGAIYENMVGEIQDKLTKDAIELSKSEFEFHKEFFAENLGVPVSLSLPSKDQILAIARTNPVQGKPFFYKRVSDGGSWLSDLSKVEVERFKNTVMQSFVNGDDLGQAIRNVRGSRSVNYSNGVFKTTQRNVEAVVRTAFRSIQQETQDIVLNELGASKVRYTAILDGRTTTICGQRDGNIYKYAERPQIPAHFNCRSLYVSVFDEKLIGDRTYISDTRNRRQREVDFRSDAKSSVGDSEWRRLNDKERRSLISKERSKWAKERIGTVPVSTTYKEWFSNQSKAFKIKRLGPERFDLYQTGGLNYSDLINKSGYFFTIDKLNEKYKILKGL